MTSYPALAAWAFAAGALIPVMGSLNGQLSRALGSAPAAATVLFTVALTAVMITIAVMRQAVPSAVQLASAPGQLYLGGLIVAFYVVSVTVLVPQFGVGNTILFAMIAQIFSSAAMDHFGLFGAMVRPVSVLRLSGLGLMLAGLIVAQLCVARGG